MDNNLIVIIIVSVIAGRYIIQLIDVFLELFYLWLSKFHTSLQITIGTMQKKHDENMELMQKAHEERMMEHEEKEPCIGFMYTEEPKVYEEEDDLEEKNECFKFNYNCYVG
jgi:hypothetical protein